MSKCTCGYPALFIQLVLREELLRDGRTETMAQLCRRVGVSTFTLWRWKRHYGLPEPQPEINPRRMYYRLGGKAKIYAARLRRRGVLK